MEEAKKPEERKAASNRILDRESYEPSQPTNMPHEQLIEKKGTVVLPQHESASCEDGFQVAPARLKNVFAFVDSLCKPQTTPFDSLTDPEIKNHRLHSRGIV